MAEEIRTVHTPVADPAALGEWRDRAVTAPPAASGARVSRT